MSLPSTTPWLSSASIVKLSEWINTPVANKMIVYAGDFENTASDVKLINYKHLALKRNP